MIELVITGITLVLCAALLVRLVLGPARRQRLDAALLRGGWACRRMTLRAWGACRRTAFRMWHWRAVRRAARAAADDAIRRARGGTWDGNVYRPDSMRKPPRDKLH